MLRHVQNPWQRQTNNLLSFNVSTFFVILSFYSSEDYQEFSLTESKAFFFFFFSRFQEIDREL